jgi:hypothetical protein
MESENQELKITVIALEKNKNESSSITDKTNEKNSSIA